MDNVPDCPVCHSAKVRLARVVNNYKVWHCSGCGLYWVPGVSDEVLVDFYGSQYFKDAREFGYADYLAGEKISRLNARTLLRTIADHSPGKPLSSLKLLDVGCAHGFLVDEACIMGFDAEGIDSSSVASEYARSTLKRKVQTGMIGSMGLPPESFDVVTSIGSIEHLNDAVRFVEDVARVIKPGGLLVITTIDTTRFFGIFRFRPPEHLYYFSHDSLSLLLESKGFTVESLTGYMAHHVFGEAFGMFCKALFSRWFDTDRIVRALPFWHTIIKMPNNEMLVVARKR